MEKIKEILKHYIFSKLITWVLFILYLFISKQIIFNNNYIQDNIPTTLSGSDYMLFFIYTNLFVYLFIIISLANLVLSILFYFINKIIPTLESILLILVILAIAITYYYTETGPNLNYIYEQNVDTFNNESDKFFNFYSNHYSYAN